VEALVAIPEGISDVDAAPLLCAGITTFNALRHSGAMPGDLVAVQGIGGWATWEFNSRTRLVTRLRLSGAAQKTQHSRRSWVPQSTSIAEQQRRQRNYKSWVKINEACH